MSSPNRGIRQLGELALRVNDLRKMEAFYLDVVGLELLTSSTSSVFFRVAEGVPGHPQIFVLFDRSLEVDSERSTIDHFAFVIDLVDYEAQEVRLQERGVHVRRKEFPVFHWRSLFFSDPEGNTVELVCSDPAV